MGSLPAGLTLSADGMISGTPTTVGTYSFTVQATNGAGDASKELTIVVEATPVAPTIEDVTLAMGTVDSEYSVALSATGDTPITWSVSVGNLPAGLTLSANGTISGTPTTAGTYIFTVQATNDAGSDTKELTIVVEAAPVAPTIGDVTLAMGTVDSEYSVALSATGDAPITWSVTSGDLPVGLTLSTDGTISGTPTTAGSYTFTVKATNDAGSDTKELIIVVEAAPVAPTIGDVTLAMGTVDSEYSVALSATGDAPITWSVTSGDLPIGLTLSTDGTISGTPTTAGSYTFTVQATNDAGSDTKEMTIVVEAAPVQPVAPTIGDVTLAMGTVDSEYSVALSATGDAPITWSVASGDLPAGLTLSADGTISGTPTTAGSYTFIVQATNDAGSDTKELTIVVEAAPVAPTISDVTLAIGTVDSEYSVVLSAIGDAPITWSVTSGDLPAGLTLSADGTISGTPTAAGIYSFTVQATSDAGSDTKELTIVVENAPVQPVTPTIRDVTLANGTIDSEYSAALSATGDAPITWSVSEGELPTGLTLSADGTISGTPTTASAYTFTVKATNNAGSDTKELTIVVEAAPVAPAIEDVMLANGTVDSTYSVALSATGDAPITWSVTSGELPAGLTLSADGTISGTPTTAGSYTFTVQATNGAGSDTKEVTIVVEATPAAPTIDEITLANGTVDSEYSATLFAAGDAPITWSVSEGELPTGLTLSVDGMITGIPTSAGTYSFTVQATNDVGSDTKALTIVVEAAPVQPVAPIIGEVTPANGIVGTPYSLTLSATGDAPITWSVTSGDLPIGLTLGADGTITGTPTTAGSYTFTVKAGNDAGNATKELTIVVEAVVVQPIVPEVAVKPSSTFVQGKAGIVTLSIGEEIDGFGIDNFKALRVDGSQLASSSNTYSVKNGSIIVQFSPTYLNTLVVGTHNVTVDLQGSGYEGMSVSTILRVIPQETQESVSEIPPKTGDKTPLMLLMILAIGACGGCLLLTKKKAKQ